jgi:hypothetical protein
MEVSEPYDEDPQVVNGPVRAICLDEKNENVIVLS